MGHICNVEGEKTHQHLAPVASVEGEFLSSGLCFIFSVRRRVFGWALIGCHGNSASHSLVSQRVASSAGASHRDVPIWQAHLRG